MENKALNQVLERIKPSKDEEEKLIKIVNEVISRIKVEGAKAVLGGSGAKGTWLRGTHDVDIYVKFNYNRYKNKSDLISEILFKELKKKFKLERLHGSRDYYQTVKGNYTFEIVPILDIKKAEEAKNITDVSQLHVDYVLKNKKYLDDIRLGKQFCRANNIYGAESYIRGFSGYVIELLVIHYKGFMNLMKLVSKWKKDQKTIIGSKEDVSKLNYAKKESPLILIDSVQRDRNAAAALSQERYEKFIDACKEFLKKPGERLFEEKKVDLKKKDVVLEIIPVKGKKDVIGAKLLKALEHIKFNLIKEGFDIKDSGFEFNEKAYLWFNCNTKISKTKEIKGPPLGMEQHTKAFREKYKDKIVIKGNRLHAVIERKYINVNEYIKELLKDKNVSSIISKSFTRKPSL